MLLFVLVLHVLWLGLVLSPQDRQGLWLSKDDLRESGCWSSRPRVLLCDIHSGLVANYDCKDSAPPQSEPGGRARVGHSSQDGDSQQQEAGPLLLPQLNRLNAAFLVRGEDASNMPTIPTQTRITTQILKHWRPFEVLGTPGGLGRLAPC
jgi:hypothetical protein